jgi:electron transfer flavoprotein alpha subunit
MPESKTILIALESHDGELRGTSYEAFSAGRELADETGGDLVSLAIGNGIADAAGTLGRFGADRVLVAESPELAA